jgi:hypothetical protein
MKSSKQISEWTLQVVNDDGDIETYRGFAEVRPGQMPRVAVGVMTVLVQDEDSWLLFSVSGQDGLTELLRYLNEHEPNATFYQLLKPVRGACLSMPKWEQPMPKAQTPNANGVNLQRA